MPDTLMRQWAMLRMIPRAPRKVAPPELKERLQTQGFSIDVRTVQRDLNRLSTMFALRCDDRSRPHGWSWAADAPVLDIPGLEPPAALAFKLAEHFMAPLMPAAVFSELKPYFATSDRLLNTIPQQLPTWPGKIRILPRGQPLKPPKVSESVMHTVYQALLEDKCFEARYWSRQTESFQDFEVHPLGLVLRSGVIYLVCTLWTYNDIRQLVLHRIQTARRLDRSVRHPPDFDLDRYIQQRHFDIASGATLRLEVLFDKETALHIQETPLSDDQEISRHSNGSIIVRATVEDTAQLRWWLLGFGQNAQVIKPDKLRNELRDTVRSMARLYGAVSA